MPFLDDDIINLRLLNGKIAQYYWGDEIAIVSSDTKRHRVQVIGRNGPVAEGFIPKKAKLRNTPLLRCSMIDVQQGDGLIIETPGGKVLFIDGGDNQLFARHAAARFSGTTANNPLDIDLMLVTHGDADHFDGLNELLVSETNDTRRKRIFVSPRRYYHNGLVKRPSEKNGVKTPELKSLGPVTKQGKATFVTGLVDDPAQVAKAERNGPFNRWIATLAEWDQRLQARSGQSIERRRIDQHSTDAFDFLADEEITVEVIGPISEPTDDGPGLRFLAEPPDDASLMLGTAPSDEPSTPSASHTINGHSIAFRLRYGNVRFLLTGDLNQAASQRLREALPDTAIRCEILKAPHHGSADFDMEFLKEAGPVVSLISSGDESELKEYIHPRATLMAALGRASRTTPAIIFITELAAFFKMIGYVDGPKKRRFFAFERTNFGIAHIRTDGERVLAFTHSGKAGMNEAYRFTVSASGEVSFAAAVTKVSAPKV